MSSDDYAHNPRTLLHIAAELRRRGISPVEVFRQSDISPSHLLNGNTWVPRALCFALGEAVETVTADRFVAAIIGTSYRLTDFGAWGHTITAAPNLSEACAVAAKGIGLLHQGTSLTFVQFRRHAQLRLMYEGRLGANPRQHLIGTLAVLRKIAALGNAADAISVHFSMPYSRSVARLEETHGARLEFGCDYNAIVVDRDLLDEPLDAAETKGRSAPEPFETAEAIGPVIRQLLPYGRANLRTIAAQQGVGMRTLQRRLRDWGFTFEEILDDVRRMEAVRHVRSGEHSIIEIAFLLGYSDPAHFTRAFRRWTGMSPRDYVRGASSMAGQHTA